MNYKIVFRIIGNVLKYELLMLLIPVLVGLYYKEPELKAFLYTILIVAPIAFLLCKIKTKKDQLYAKEGFLIVGLSWIIISFTGGIPFVISGAMPSIIDAFFETVSGFTTTGATILTEIQSLPNCILFWRSFTHWVGGMGFLIFMLALIPSLGGNSIHILKAESPGPAPGKIVPRIKDTAKILYLLYFVLTVIETILLKIAGLSWFNSIMHAISTAGTGGFSNMNASVAAFNNPAVEWIITIFMILFGVNFALYFQLLKRNFTDILKSEELHYYLLMIFVSAVLITINITDFNNGNITKSIRDSSFQVASIITTTGYATADFNLWPTFSKNIIILLTFAGAMAGSTGGGIKTVRIVLIFKAIKREIDKILHPKRIKSVKMDGKVVNEEIINGVFLFLGGYIIITLIAIFIVALDGFDVVTTSTAVITTISNVGPGLGAVGPTGNFAAFSPLSKMILSFCMLAGRLEIYPMIILFSPSIWRKTY